MHRVYLTRLDRGSNIRRRAAPRQNRVPSDKLGTPAHKPLTYLLPDTGYTMAWSPGPDEPRNCMQLVILGQATSSPPGLRPPPKAFLFRVVMACVQVPTPSRHTPCYRPCAVTRCLAGAWTCQSRGSKQDKS